MRVILKQEAVGRSALCPVVELSNELGKRPVFRLLFKVAKNKQTETVGFIWKDTALRIFSFPVICQSSVHLGNFSKTGYCVVSPVMNEPEEFKTLTHQYDNYLTKG